MVNEVNERSCIIIFSVVAKEPNSELKRTLIVIKNIEKQ
jgi:hypothetical protein